MDIKVNRNAFGRQVDSFEVDLPISLLGEEPFHAVFIRAPIVTDVGEGVEIIAKLEDGKIVGVQSGHLLATAFHPELTDDNRLHQHFVKLVAG
jgi:5'-phosphate synthase pdxT subunit